MVGGGVLPGRVHDNRTHELALFIHKIVNQRTINLCDYTRRDRVGALFYVALFPNVDTWGGVGVDE